MSRSKSVTTCPITVLLCEIVHVLQFAPLPVTTSPVVGYNLSRCLLQLAPLSGVETRYLHFNGS